VPRLLLVALFAFEGVPRRFISSAASASDVSALQVAPYLASMRWAGHAYLGSIGKGSESCCFVVSVATDYLNRTNELCNLVPSCVGVAPRHSPGLAPLSFGRSRLQMFVRSRAKWPSLLLISLFSFSIDSDRPSQSCTAVPHLLPVPALVPASGRGRERASGGVPRQPGAATSGRRGVHLGRGARLLHPRVPHEDLQRRLPGGSARGLHSSTSQLKLSRSGQ